MSYEAETKAITKFFKFQPRICKVFKNQLLDLQDFSGLLRLPALTTVCEDPPPPSYSRPKNRFPTFALYAEATEAIGR